MQKRKSVRWIVLTIAAGLAVACTTTYDVQRMVEAAAWETAEVLADSGPRTVVVSYFTLDGRIVRMSNYLIDSLTAELASTIKEFELESRVVNRRQLDQVLAELQFQASDLSGAAIAQVGGKLGADLVLTGSITPMGEIFVLSAQLIEVATGIVVAGSSYEFWADEDLVR